jgi:hypothetical protein
MQNRTITVEERNAVLIEALRKLGAGAWHDRAAIAEALGKSRLNPADILALDVLASQGAIEKGMEPTELITVSKWMYRVKGE